MGCGCGGSKKVGTTVGKAKTVAAAAAAPTTNPGSKASRSTVVTPPPPPRQTRPVEYCVVNGGRVISCFETMAEAKVERASTGATSVVTRYL